MSKRRAKLIISRSKVDQKQVKKAKEKSKKSKKQIKKATKTGLNIVKRAAQASAGTAATGTAAAGTAAAGTAAAGTAAGSSLATTLGVTAVAAPPFSTAAAVVIGVGVVTIAGVHRVGKRRSKFLSKDADTLKKMTKKYMRKSSKWRKKEIAKLLKEYDKHLAKGNKKTVALMDGDKKRKSTLQWRAKKSKIEMEIRAIYAAQYENGLLKPVKKTTITPKQADAEKSVIKKIKAKQINSIDPRTSSTTLIKPGIVEITPKQAAAEIVKMRVPDTSIIKLAEKPDLTESQASVIENAIDENNRESIAMELEIEEPMPIGLPTQELQEHQEESKQSLLDWILSLFR